MLFLVSVKIEFDDSEWVPASERVCFLSICFYNELFNLISAVHYIRQI